MDNQNNYQDSSLSPPPSAEGSILKEETREQEPKVQDNNNTTTTTTTTTATTTTNNKKVKKIKLVSNYTLRSSKKTKTAKRGEQPVQQQQRQLRPRQSKLPNIIVLYRNDCPGRLYSIYNRTTREYIYHHEKDADKPIRTIFNQGAVEALQNIETGEILYLKHLVPER